MWIGLSGCLSQFPTDTQEPAQLPAVRATVPFSLNEVTCPTGACVFKRQSTHLLKAQFQPKTANVIVRSCHRFEAVSVADPAKPKLEFRYTPAYGLENQGSCVLFVVGVREDGSRQMAIADFSGDETAKATVHCNGQRLLTEGASLCQSLAGLVQAIWFEEPARVYFPERCAEPVATSALTRFEIPLSPRLCTYLFVLKSGAKHRLTTWGFTDAAITP